MKVLLHRILIILYALFIRCLPKHAVCDNEKKVLIIFQQVFGDAILFSDSLQMYTALFPKAEGWDLTMICRPSIAVFMWDVLPPVDGIKIEEVDFTRLVSDFRYFRDIVKKYSSVGFAIVPATSLSAELLSAALPAKKRITQLLGVNRKWPPHLVLIQKAAYTETIRPPADMMMLQRHRELLKAIRPNTYKAGIPNLLPKERIVPEGRYCVVCPGASTTVKMWPQERFANVIDHLIENYQMTVYMCGGASEKETGEQVLNLVKRKGRVFDRIGDTSFSDWSSLIQHAELVVGNDSATVHMAAAARVPTLCITGVYDKGLFWPYAVDKSEPGKLLPVAIMHDMPCAMCRQKGYWAGYKNRTCRKQIRSGRSALCIDCITVDEVLNEVESLLHRDKIDKCGQRTPN